MKTAQTTGSANYPQWGLSWTYDRYGNRLSQSQTFDGTPTNSVTVNPATNRITDPGYGYDANGNMTGDGLNTLTYDGENRVVSSATGGTTSSYTYDGKNLRVKKQVGSATATVYIFSGSKVVAEYAAGAGVGSPTREYIYSGSQLLATIEGSATKYHHSDHLSLRVTTDTNGVKIADSGHYPYGENWYETGGANKLKFTSYARDNGTGESGNDYAMMRYHVNRLGRFSSPDLIAGAINNPQLLNRFAYVQDDPLNLIDPFGLQGCAADTCIDVSGAPDYFDTTNSVIGGWNYAAQFGGPGATPLEQILAGGRRGPGGGQEPPDIRGPIPGGNADLSKLVGPAKEPENPCPVTAQSLNAYLQGSPLAGQGNGFLNAGKTYNVDPRFTVALAGAETRFGRNITRGQYNAWNWLWNRQDPANSSFSSWGAGINAVTRGIAGPNYFQAKQPLTNASSIYAKYCQGPDCANGLRNLNTFLAQQGGDPNQLRFPCN